MKQINIGFLWHMHQPDYWDTETSEYLLPWVRLHGIRAYYDMAKILEECPLIKPTFNLSPSLIKQLLDYSEGASDAFLRISLKNVSDLSPEEKRVILSQFFSNNWEKAIKPFPEYYRLLEKRGMNLSASELERVSGSFTNQEFRDLQVLFNLSWFGHKAFSEEEELRELKKKGKGFTEREKASLLNLQIQILKKLIPLYRNLLDKGQIDISINPFYHPIIPLIIDTDCARKAVPDIVLPQRFAFSEDIEAQLKSACQLYWNVFQQKPSGLWPPEGGVSAEMIPIVEKFGFRWIGTDERILNHSLPREFNKIKDLYRPYQFQKSSGHIKLIFRDNYLSNLLSFNYYKLSEVEAVNHFISQLRDILANTVMQKEGLVAIMLDGENPWENYDNNGYDFLRELYFRLGNMPEFQVRTLTDYIAEMDHYEPLADLFPGSWIDANFKVWIGGREENKAWNVLRQTRNWLMEKVKPVAPSKIGPENIDTMTIAAEASKINVGKACLDEEVAEGLFQEVNLNEDFKKAMEHIYKAEGSDWFWWYGENFSSNNDEHFDYLFRANLMQVYRIFNERVPDVLADPIMNGITLLYEPPVYFVQPKIDGVSSFYEWAGSGGFDASRFHGSMFKRAYFLNKIYFGFDPANLFFRMDPSDKFLQGNKQGICARVNIVASEKRFRVIFDFDQPDQFTLVKITPQQELIPIGNYPYAAFKEIIELKVPFKLLGLSEGEPVSVSFKIIQDDVEIERYPKAGRFDFQIPSKNFESINWFL